MSIVLRIVFGVVASGLMLAGIWMFCRDVGESLFGFDDFTETEETADEDDTMLIDGETE